MKIIIFNFFLLIKLKLLYKRNQAKEQLTKLAWKIYLQTKTEMNSNIKSNILGLIGFHQVQLMLYLKLVQPGAN